MKKVTKITMDGLQVDSEPGDCTRYEYLLILNTKRASFQILPARNSVLTLPLEICVQDAFTLWKEIKDMTGVKEQARYIQKIIKDLRGCNPFTYAEIIRTIGESYEHILNK